MVEGRRARCDGGGGALGHPAVWINLVCLQLIVKLLSVASEDWSDWANFECCFYFPTI